jgi:hypothetical protein
VVGEDGEVARFKHMAEILYGLVDDLELGIVDVVLLLGRVEFFFREERVWLPGVLNVLL